MESLGIITSKYQPRKTGHFWSWAALRINLPHQSPFWVCTHMIVSDICMCTYLSMKHPKCGSSWSWPGVVIISSEYSHTSTPLIVYSTWMCTFLCWDPYARRILNGPFFDLIFLIKSPLVIIPPYIRYNSWTCTLLSMKLPDHGPCWV